MRRWGDREIIKIRRSGYQGIRKDRPGDKEIGR